MTARDKASNTAHKQGLLDSDRQLNGRYFYIGCSVKPLGCIACPVVVTE